MFTPKLHGEAMPRRAKSFKSYACAKLHPPWKMLNEAHFGRFHGFTWFHHDGLEPLRKHTVVCRPSVFCKPLGSWPLSVPQNTGQLAAATTCSHDKLPEPLTSVNLSRYDPQLSPPSQISNFYLQLSKWMSAKPPVQTQSPKPPLLRFCLCLGHPRRVPPLQWAARGRPGAPRRHRCARRLPLKRDIVTLFFALKMYVLVQMIWQSITNLKTLYTPVIIPNTMCSILCLFVP